MQRVVGWLVGFFFVFRHDEAKVSIEWIKKGKEKTPAATSQPSAKFFSRCSARYVCCIVLNNPPSLLRRR